MQSLQELLQIPQTKKLHSERAELIKFFLENVLDRKGKQYRPQFMAIKLAHIPTKDLHYSISIYKDTLKRKNRMSADKEFWWSIKGVYN